MDLHITLAGPNEHAARIYRQLLDAILDGRLREGTRLPATRALAEQLAVSRTTVALAYERLVAEGYLTGRVGSGTFVAPDVCLLSTDPGAPEDAESSGPTARAVWADLPLSDTSVEDGLRYAFAIGLPDLELFPFEEWRRLVSRELRVGSLGTGDYNEPAGLPRLRSAIARHYGVSRGLRASAEDVLVTHGAQQAVDLVARVLVEPGETVAMEDPGYAPVRHAFTSLGARVAGVPVDQEGLVVDALPATARLVYVTPSHQFPLGVTMSPARRAALLAWARRIGAVVIEDDYDSEYRFTERPLQPMHSIDMHHSVVYIGTFSKTMFPALRLGFLVAPPSLRTALRTAKQLTDWHTDTVTQSALAGFIDEGLLARHIRRAARNYAQRRSAIQAWLATRSDVLEALPGSAGLHLTARLWPDVDVDVDEAVRRANAAGVLVRSLAPFHVDTPVRDGFMLGYGAIPADRIPAGLAHLAAALR